MAQLRQDYQQFVNAGAEVIVVGPEKPENFKNFWAENDLPFIGLPDPEHSVLKLYGQEVNLFKLGRMPAQVIVDQTGTARYVHYGKSMSDIPSNEELFDIIRSLNNGKTDPSGLSNEAHIEWVAKKQKKPVEEN